MSPRYPVMVDLAGRPCLVVGGGEVATRKVLGLLASEALVTVRAPELSAPLAQLAGAGRIRWEEQTYTGLGVADDGRPWSLVLAATDDVAVNRRVGIEAAAVGAWANDATDPTGGAAAVPASWHGGPVTIAVSTDGVHPGAARWLCDQAALTVTPEALAALDLVDEMRLDDVAGGGLGRRPDWRLAVESGTLELIREGHLAEAKERLQACLSSSSD
ncbi:MAG TPA: bifunctional precorrin-2 dehydrogenase/sirohydrochlorin ferrochelatase [Acidimicrobiales bacterium]|nr:bifunctional precorrin-2 dehydrogenase/sirohydrochlorin ferrochelatase [Acidimicrobiales bacterium]